jgi:conjugal transfer pilus assembly protein TrbC
MGTLSFKGRIAVRHIRLSNMRLLVSIVSLVLYSNTNADTFASSFTGANGDGASAFIFVSTKMPRTSLVDIASESSRSGAVLVFAGYEEGKVDPALMSRFINKLNDECCRHTKPVNPMIHPKLFADFEVKSVPTFALARRGSNDPKDFVKVSGDMSFGNALKFIYQESKSDYFRYQAKETYKKLFH